jgi:hypothetical protein
MSTQPSRHLRSHPGLQAAIVALILSLTACAQRGSPAIAPDHPASVTLGLSEYRAALDLYLRQERATAQSEGAVTSP